MARLAIQHLNAISHDGKVVFFGVDPDGVIWYAVKRSGFEDTALTPGSDPFGFDDWKPLALGLARADASVEADELANLTYDKNKYLLQSLYGDGDELVRTVQAPVQLVSALGNIHVFRQSPAGQLLVSRFVLDGLRNELVPKLDVRFRRSGQRLSARTNKLIGGGPDSLDFRDINNNPFYEPTTWLAFIPKLANGWFTAAFVATNDGSRSRWHVFASEKVYEEVNGKVNERDRLVLHSLAASESGLFDVKDAIVAELSGDETTYRTVPGLTSRALEFQNLKLMGRPTAVLYDVQSERNTKAGPQLVREETRLMLAVPVREIASPTAPTTVVAVSFAIANDGTLSQIDLTPDTVDVLRSKERDVLLPVDELDRIKVLGAALPPPTGTIVGMQRATDDRVRVQAKAPVAVVAGDTVRVTGTRSHDGSYRVVTVDGSAFTVEATFTASEVGSWAVVPAKETGLVFDNMVVGYEKTVDGKLKVTCASHDLKVDDEVQIVGTDAYDGAIKVVAADASGFVLDAPWRPGEARNVKKIARSGLTFDGAGDYLVTPTLALTLPDAPVRPFGRTISAWIKAPALASRVQRLIGGEDEALALSLTADNKVQLAARFSDGTIRTIVDPAAIVADTWIHVAGTIAYDPAVGGDTRMSLCRNGAKVTPVAAAGERIDGKDKVVPRDTPGHLETTLIAFDGVDDQVVIPDFTAPLVDRSFTIELWARRERAGAVEYLVHQGTDTANKALFIGFRASNAFTFGFFANDLETPAIYNDTAWHHFACTYESVSKTHRIYCDGVLVASRVATSQYQGSGPLSLGRHSTPKGPFKGRLADVRVWQRARDAAEIRSDMSRLLKGTEANLVGHWPLGGQNPAPPGGQSMVDRSSRKQHGVLGGAPASTPALFRQPAVPVHGALEFTKDGQAVTCTEPELASRDFSISLWIRRAANTSDVQRIVLYLGRDETSRGLYLGFRAGTGKFTFAFFNNDLDTTDGYTDTAWHHYCCTYEHSTRRRRIYRDGVQVAEAIATQAFLGSRELTDGESPNQKLTIGMQSTASAFRGCLAELRIWNRTLTADEAKVDMWSCPTGTEAGLLRYWPLDGGQALDLSPYKAVGTFTEVAPSQLALVHAIAGVCSEPSTRFAGELADVRIWDRPLDADTIKNDMNLLLTGREDGLVAYYRMGAVVADDPATPVVPDFTPAAAHAQVFGTPHGGARRLAAKTGDGKPAIKYSNADLIAVLQLATYEERFEFKVTDDATFNPANIDGQGNRLFVFAYWGKRSASAGEVIALPASCVQQVDFKPAGGGWFVATCRVTIPAGVQRIRVFEVADVRSTWKAGAEWSSFQVRRHRLRLISDSVSRERFTDVIAPVKLTGPASGAIASLAEAETKFPTLYATIRDLTLRLEVARDRQKFVDERTPLAAMVPPLASQRDKAEADLKVQREHLGNYRMLLRNAENSLCLYPGTPVDFLKNPATVQEKSQLCLWEGEYVDDTWFRLRSRTMIERSGWLYALYADCAVFTLGIDGEALHWRVAVAPAIPFLGLPHERREPDDPKIELWSRVVGAGLLTSSANFVSTAARGLLPSRSQMWRVEEKALTEDGARRVAVAEARYNTLVDKVAQLSWLNEKLDRNETASAVETLLSAAKKALDTAWTAYNTTSTTALKELAADATVRMARVACDARGRITQAGLLDFVRPLGAVTLSATCEGNVQLAYVDTRGRLRATLFDATADSRNATFDQWLADSERACVDCRESSYRLSLAKPITLPAAEWTVEAWFHHPPINKADGGLNVLVGGESQVTGAPLCIRGGDRLGTLVEGFFHDSGVNLDRTLAPGWHHAAAVFRDGGTRFYIDGAPIGSPPQARRALHVYAEGWIDIPSLGQRFDKGITAEAWVYYKGPPQDSSQRGILTNVANATTGNLQFAVNITGHKLRAGFSLNTKGGWLTVDDKDAFPQFQWVHVAATYDGRYIRLYRDGALVATSENLNVSLPVEDTAWRIGHGNLDIGGSRWTGQITEVRLWSASRSTGEIREAMHTRLTGKETALVGYWPMHMFTDPEDNVRKIEDLGPLKPTKKKHGTPSGTTSELPLLPQCRAAVTTLGNFQTVNPLVVVNPPPGGSPAGKLAEVRLWRVALGDAELAAASKRSATGNEPDLLAYWPLSEGAFAVARDRVAGNHAALSGARWAVCTANLGNPGHGVAGFVDDAAEVRCLGGPNLANSSFTIELWVRRGRVDSDDFVVSQGTNATNRGLHLGFRPDNSFRFGFFNNDLDSGATYSDNAWHHWACTYDKAAKEQKIFRDGVWVATRSQAAAYEGSGDLMIGRFGVSGIGALPFRGQIAEVRAWGLARTQDEIREAMQRRLTGREDLLLGYWPLTEAAADGATPELCQPSRPSKLNGAVILRSNDLPLAGGVDVVACEYATVGVGPDGARQGMMRRCLGVADGGAARFFHDARVEALTLRWLGNVQFKPTLLGYIEGPPPVPSENLVIQQSNYVDATSVALTQTDSVEYRWDRSETSGQAFNLDLFVGSEFELASGLGFSIKTSGLRSGVQAFYDFSRQESRQSAVVAGSTLSQTNAIGLRGAWEATPAFPHLGRRYVPKNVGYALVVTGLADVFALVTARTGRMVDYEARPVEGMPLDINTITFLINPAYTYNGSLDGMIGSAPADARFYGHVPAMRAQFGGQCPASYYRPAEAYKLADELEKKDKERASVFMNYDATNLDAPDAADAAEDAPTSDDARAEAANRQTAINGQIAGVRDQVRAAAGFADWQSRMQALQTRSGKRNIVNKYVWDADGGLRAETQGFAETILHSVGCEVSHAGGAGLDLGIMMVGFKLELGLLGSGSSSKSSSKTLGQTRAFELAVDLSGLESEQITALDDTPLQPGEKVDRYRMMTFYLEGDTKHFDEFFSTVVDPEWLASNDEEARTLREVNTTTPNACWRVLHRVTYVERPALMGFGRDVGALKKR